MSTSRRKVTVTKRHYMWWADGKKDGMCGVLKHHTEVPRQMKSSYNNGHTVGMLLRLEEGELT